MKTAIVYYSQHHGNTKKLLDGIAAQAEVTLIEATANPDVDLSGYDLIGFASGIYFSKFHKSVLACAEKNLSPGQRVFFICTYGNKRPGFTAALEQIAQEKGAQVAGDFGCLGYDTFGPLKLIGGLAKGRPNEEDIAAAVSFFREIAAGGPA